MKEGESEGPGEEETLGDGVSLKDKEEGGEVVSVIVDVVDTEEEVDGEAPRAVAVPTSAEREGDAEGEVETDGEREGVDEREVNPLEDFVGRGLREGVAREEIERVLGGLCDTEGEVVGDTERDGD